MDLGILTMKGYTALPRSLEKKPHYQMQFRVVNMTYLFWRVGENLPFVGETSLPILSLTNRANPVKKDEEYIRVIQKNSKHHLERRAIAERFLLCQHTVNSYKTKKTNSGSCLNFSAAKAHTKVRGIQQI